MGIIYMIYISYFVKFSLFFNYVKINYVNWSNKLKTAFEEKDAIVKIWRNVLSHGNFPSRYDFVYFPNERSMIYIFEKHVFPAFNIYKNYFQGLPILLENSDFLQHVCFLTLLFSKFRQIGILLVFIYGNREK